MNHNKIKPIEPNYHEDDAIILLERWYDVWTKEEDWWSGGNTWDLNIFTEYGEKEYDYGSRWVINVYELEQHSDSELLSTNTHNKLDKFEIKL